MAAWCCATAADRPFDKLRTGSFLESGPVTSILNTSACRFVALNPQYFEETGSAHFKGNCFTAVRPHAGGYDAWKRQLATLEDIG